MPFRTLPGVLVNLLLVVLVIVYTHKKQYRKLFLLIILSTLGDVFGLRFLGPDIRLAHFIGLVNIHRTLPFYYKMRKKKEFGSVNILLLELPILLVTGVYFGFVNPWVDPDYFRSWNQAAQGRTITTWANYISNISIVLFVAYVTVKRKITYENVVETLVPLCSFSLLFAILSYFSPVNFVTLIWGVRDLTGRFYGWFGEPKEFGKTAVVSFAVLYLAKLFKINSYKYLNIGIGVTVITIFLSQSTSSLVIWFAFIVIIHSSKNGSILKNILIKNYVPFILMVIVLVGTYEMLSRTQMFQEQYANKINQIIYSDVDDRIDDVEPLLFTKFEIWDRVASNFLYRFPNYILFGVGPNLIHIPSTKYASEKHRKTFKGQLNSVPKMGWLNIICRSGVVGLSLWIVSLVKLIRYTKKRKNIALFILTILAFLFYFVTIGQWFFVIFGYIIGTLLCDKLNRGFDKNAEYYNTGFKWRKVYTPKY